MSLKKLKDLAKKADIVWLASDEDRRWKAIAWRQRNFGLDKAKTNELFS
jgi:DNA topoisomerase-1